MHDVNLFNILAVMFKCKCSKKIPDKPERRNRRTSRLSVIPVPKAPTVGKRSASGIGITGGTNSRFRTSRNDKCEWI